jgi:hypothetical protein
MKAVEVASGGQANSESIVNRLVRCAFVGSCLFPITSISLMGLMVLFAVLDTGKFPRPLKMGSEGGHFFVRQSTCDPQTAVGLYELTLVSIPLTILSPAFVCLAVVACRWRTRQWPSASLLVLYAVTFMACVGLCRYDPGDVLLWFQD